MTTSVDWDAKPQPKHTNKQELSISKKKKKKKKKKKNLFLEKVEKIQVNLNDIITVGYIFSPL